MNWLLDFVQSNKAYVDLAHAMSAVVNLLGWIIGGVLLTIAWRRNGIRTVAVGPIEFQMQEAAVEATASAARDWKTKTPTQTVDVSRIRETVAQAFTPEISQKLVGKSVLWVDDIPSNNRLAVRALKRMQLDVEQVTSTELGLAALAQNHFDLVISDMGRGQNLRAGYDLLKAIRETGSTVPFLIFASQDTPSFRREAAANGAQLSTNDMLELVDHVIKHLGH